VGTCFRFSSFVILLCSIYLNYTLSLVWPSRQTAEQIHQKLNRHLKPHANFSAAAPGHHRDDVSFVICHCTLRKSMPARAELVVLKKGDNIQSGDRVRGYGIDGKSEISNGGNEVQTVCISGQNYCSTSMTSSNCGLERPAGS